MLKIKLHISLFIVAICLFSCDSKEKDDDITTDPLKSDRKALIIGIDGFRSDIMQESITPFIYSLQHENVYYNLAHITEEITYSGPNWSSMLTGVHLNKHNVTNNAFDNNNLNDYPPFFEYIERADSDINTGSIVNWTPINSYVLSNISDHAPLEAMNDATVFENAYKMLVDGDPIDVDVLFLQFDELDGAGHAYGFSPLIEGYINTANTIDSYVADLFDIIQSKRANGEDWIYMIISDHGGEGTSHGDATHPDINTTIFLAEHPSLQFSADCCYISNQTDLATTVLDFMGISSPEFNNNTDGVSIIEQ